MRPERFVLSDAQWQVIAPLLPGKASDCGVTARDNRLFFRSGAMARAYRRALAGFTIWLWRLEQHFPEVSPLGGFRRFRSYFQYFVWRA